MEVGHATTQYKFGAGGRREGARGEKRGSGRAHATVSQLDGVKAPSASAVAQQQSPSATAGTTVFSHSDVLHAVEGEWFGCDCAFSTADGAHVNISVR